MSWSVVVIVQPDGEVAKWKRVDYSSPTTSTATTAVLANQLLGELQSEGFEILEGARSARGLHQDVSVGDGHIKEKEKNIFIKFSALRSAAVVSTQLISTIHSSHELVVGYDALWARYFQATPVSLPVNSAMTRRLTVGGHHHHLLVHPGTCIT